MDAPSTGQAAATATAPAVDDAREARRDLVAIGASAGGVDALKRLATAMPPDYGGALFVVVHISPESHSSLPAILSRVGPLPAVHATDNMPIEHGRIHVAPP